MCPGPNITGSWAIAFEAAIREFNRLSSTHSFGVTLTRSASPPTNAKGGANVLFEAIDVSQTFASFMGPVPVTLDPGLAGHTANVLDGSGRIGQSFACVPLSPQVSVGPTGQQKQREAGHGIKLVLAVHELIHTTGLGNETHTSPPNQDLFFDANSARQGTLDNDPDHDHLELRDTGRIPAPHMPPLFLNAQTILGIQLLWSLPLPRPHFPRFPPRLIFRA